MKSVNELKQIRQNQIEHHSRYRYQICICGGTSCSSVDSLNVYEQLLKELKENHLEEQVEVICTGCHGLCAKGPVMTIYPDNVTYCKLTPDDVEQIIDDHLLHGEVVGRLLYINIEQRDKTPAFKPLQYSDFYLQQQKVVMRNCGRINRSSRYIIPSTSQKRIRKAN